MTLVGSLGTIKHFNDKSTEIPGMEKLKWSSPIKTDIPHLSDMNFLLKFNGDYLQMMKKERKDEWSLER